MAPEVALICLVLISGRDPRRIVLEMLFYQAWWAITVSGW
jgi:hypothetical protein